MQVCYYRSVATIRFYVQCSIKRYCSEMGDFQSKKSSLSYCGYIYRSHTMDSDTESEISSCVHTSTQTPTHTPMQIQFQPDLLRERWTEVQTEMGSEMELVPVSGIVSPNILVRIKLSKNSIQPFSVLLQIQIQMLKSFQTFKTLENTTKNSIQMCTHMINNRATKLFQIHSF